MAWGCMTYRKTLVAYRVEARFDSEDDVCFSLPSVHLPIISTIEPT